MNDRLWFKKTDGPKPVRQAKPAVNKASPTKPEFPDPESNAYKAYDDRPVGGGNQNAYQTYDDRPVAASKVDPPVMSFPAEPE